MIGRFKLVFGYVYLSISRVFRNKPLAVFITFLLINVPMTLFNAFVADVSFCAIKINIRSTTGTEVQTGG